LSKKITSKRRVLLKPLLNKDDIVTIIGYSGEKETIDGFEGTWLFVFKGTIKGWVFSKYVHIAAIEYAPIQFVDLIPTDNEHIPLIKISYELPGSVKIIEPDFISWKNYFIIVWGPYNKGLHNPTFNGRYCQGKRVAGYYCL
jgi:hypothetical protein